MASDEDSFLNNLFLSSTIRSPLYKFLKLVKEKWTEEENEKRDKEKLNYQKELRERYEKELQKVTLEHNANLKILQEKLREQDAHIHHLNNCLTESKQKIKEQKKELNECHSCSTHIDRVSHQVNHHRQRQSRHKEQEKHRDMSCSQECDNKFSAIKHIEPKVPTQEQQSHSPSRDTSEPLIHQRKRSSSVGSRRLYGEIRPGNITHEDIQRSFSTYFTKYRRQYGTQLVANHGIKQSIPCIIMQLAFNKCKEIVLKKMKSRLLNQDNHEVIKAIQLLNQCANEMPVKETFSLESHPSDELNVLFNEPEKKTDKLKFWDERKCAFALLLGCIIIDNKNVHRTVKCHILLNMKSIRYPSQMAEEAAKLALDMITLVPPAIVCQPKQYQEDWQDKRTTYWKEDSDIPSIYFRPVLFFSALGHIGCKGEVGNTIPRHKAVQYIEGTSLTSQFQCPPPPNERSNEATTPAGNPNLTAIRSSTGTSQSETFYQNEGLRKSFNLPDKHTLKTCSKCSHMTLCQTYEGQYTCENCIKKLGALYL